MSADKDPLLRRPIDPIRAALPALGLVALGVLAGVAARDVWPGTPPWVVRCLIGALIGSALLLGPFRRAAFSRYLLETDLFFLSGVVAALVWANVDLASLEALVGPVRFAVNEVLMALFFGLATKEIVEATLPGGPLASPRKAALPLVATAGGMLGPAAVYLAGCALLGRPDLTRGWAIPTATDVAFSALVVRFIFGAAHPAIPFLLLLAIADDAAGLAVLAIAYPQGERHVVPLLLLVGGGMVACVLLRRLARAESPWPYLLLGGVPCWFGLHEGGLHPALALVPIVPFMPHGAHDAGIYQERSATGLPLSTLERFQRGAAAPVALTLGLFGLSNAGVPLAGMGVGDRARARRAPRRQARRDLRGGGARDAARARRSPTGCARGTWWCWPSTAGVGFTVALFVSTVAFPAATSGAVLTEAKMGALLSVVAAPLAIAAARLARRAADRPTAASARERRSALDSTAPMEPLAAPRHHPAPGQVT
jgi:NhaA family Na+:H+ antiporter